MENMKYLVVFCFCISGILCPAQRLYTFDECLGSQSPYPEINTVASYPDSLTPVFINHVSRHGARYASSAKTPEKVLSAFRKADSLGTITSEGREIMGITEEVIRLSKGKWGSLDSLGAAEQRGIAERMYRGYMPVFESGGEVSALASYVPRSMMSMYEFTHQLDRMSHKLEYNTSTGEINSVLMRPFEVDSAYLRYRREEPYKALCDRFTKEHCPVNALDRFLGKDFPYKSEGQKRDILLDVFHVLMGMRSIGRENVLDRYFTLEEANGLWECFNFTQYYERVSNNISSVPADIAGPLVLDFISTTDRAIYYPQDSPKAVLRFGHAETMMPFLSLIGLKGCAYKSDNPADICRHWKNFHVIPMASNFRMILFRSATGRYYVRAEFNETPVRLIPGDSRLVVPWGDARMYLMGCVPR